MRQILLWLSLLVGFLPVDAQPPRLIDLTPEQFMTNIVDISREIDPEDFLEFRRIILNELDIRYPNLDLSTVPYDVLAQFDQAMAMTFDTTLARRTGHWLNSMFVAALRDYAPDDLGTTSTLGRFSILGVEAVDFIPQTHPEFLVSAQLDFLTFSGVVVPTDDGNWQFYALPLPFSGLSGNIGTREMPESGSQTRLYLGDLTGDSYTDWVVEVYHFGSWRSCFQLYVITWEDDAFVNLAEDQMKVCLPLNTPSEKSIRYHYRQSYEEPLVSIIAIDRDGWLCQRQETRALTKDRVDYETHFSVIYQPTAWCDLAMADKAFQSGEFVLAAQLTQRALDQLMVEYTQPIPEPVIDSYPLAAQTRIEMPQYLGARIALGYALAGDMVQARAILGAISPQGQMGELITPLREAAMDGTAVEVCQTFHDYFRGYAPTPENPNDQAFMIWKPSDFVFGDQLSPAPHYYPWARPEVAGCDLAWVRPVSPMPTLMPPPLVVGASVAIAFLYPEGYAREGIFTDLKNQNYDQALEALDSVSQSDFGKENAPRIAYLRALTLEFAGRADDATAAYTALAQEFPDTTWGKLAEIHRR